MVDISTIVEEARSHFADAKGSHGWDHTLRVHNLCIHIGLIEHADIRVLELASLLHDIARKTEDDSKGDVCHAELGSRMAKDILKRFGEDPATIKNVTHCIAAHRYRNEIEPKTLEAKILFDSDKLDSIGAIGIGRAFLFSGEIGARLHNLKHEISGTEAYSDNDTAYREFIVKLSKVRGRMMTDEGRRIADARHEFMDMFFNRMKKEIDGEL